MEQNLGSEMKKTIEIAFEEIIRKKKNCLLELVRPSYFERTEIILKNLNTLKEQTENFEVDLKDLTIIKEQKINDLMNDVFLKEDKTMEEVILESRKKTQVFVKYIEKTLKKYIQIKNQEIKNNSDKYEKEKRKLLILEQYYMAKGHEINDFIENYDISLPTFKKYNKELIEELSIMFFGIDGLNVI